MAAMSIRVHGVRRHDDESGELLFGMHKLLSRVENQFRPTRVEPRPGSNLWPDVWVDGLFVKAQHKFHRLCWDSLHAATNLERTVQAAGEILLDSMSDRPAEMDAVATATKDATLYLDLFMFYFRIHADCLATVVPNLYGQAGRCIGKRARESFRQHRRWFQKNSGFDPEYGEIVKQHTRWFDLMSGDHTGWRDDLVHRFGTWQIALRVGPVTELLVGIDRPVHPPYPNLLDEFRGAVGDYCAFLDATTDHFARRINSQTQVPIFDLADERHWGCSFIKGGGTGLWMLPTLPG